jgi:hypothetical protein
VAFPSGWDTNVYKRLEIRREIYVKALVELSCLLRRIVIQSEALFGNNIKREATSRWLFFLPLLYEDEHDRCLLSCWLKSRAGDRTNTRFLPRFRPPATDHLPSPSPPLCLFIFHISTTRRSFATAFNDATSHPQ